MEEAGTILNGDVMDDIGLIENGRYTNLALLISDQCPSKIYLSAYADRRRTRFVSRTEVEGSILGQMDRAMLFLEENSHIHSESDRSDKEGYPPSALKEAILNAIVHRDYSIEANILISIYGRRISIVSYGRLIDGVKIEDMMRGTSSVRNPKLMALFNLLGLTKASGTGIPHIMENYGRFLLKPRIVTTPNVFRMELPTTIPVENGQIDADNVMAYAEEHGFFTISEVCMAISKSKAETEPLLSILIANRLLEMVMRGNEIGYVLSD